jgi:outer membrane protein assembly factor BamB
MFFRYLDVGRDGEIDADEWKKLVAWVESWEHANGIIAIRPQAEGTPAEIAWRFPRGVPECPSPLAYRGHLYVVMNGGLVTCLDARTGGLRFQERLGARGPYYASLVAGDGKIWAASARGEVTVFRAGDSLQILSATDLDERLMATPALQGGVVYVRTDRHLHAFGRAL